MDVESSRQQGPKGDASSNSMAAASEVSVDWRGRPCRPERHGGMKAAVLVLGIQAFEIMAIAAVGNNLITYVFNEMHFPLSKSANIVTNFIGTMFLLSLLGGFLSDSYLGSFWTMLIFGFVELSGFILLAVQAHLPQLRPPACDMKAAGQCEEVAGVKAGIFFAALYLVALGSGCLKPNIIAHGADQFRRDGEDQAVDGGKRLSSYFNAAYFSFCVGEMVALTVLVWVQTRSGMDVGFGVSAAAMAVGLVSLVAGVFFYRNKPPQGSICTPIAKVFVAAVAKRKQVCPSSRATVQGMSSTGAHETRLNTTNICRINKLRFLDKACVKAQDGGSKESEWGLCTAAEVEQVKVLLCVVPIFACTIVFNTILAQLQTFSVQQGSAMDTRLAANFHVPPASLQAIPYIMLIVLVPAYEAVFVPAVRRLTGGRRAGRGPPPSLVRLRRRASAVHLLDRAAVPGVRAVGDVHGRGAHRVLLQAVALRHAGLPHLHDLLLLLLRLLPQLRAGVARQQGDLEEWRKWLAQQQRPRQGQARPLLLAPGRAQRPQLLQLPLLVEVVLQQRRDGAGCRSWRRWWQQ
ncbi:unnamed protein product [Triticum turgidum subsp. durum]|uniref:Protein NRT1/ PTR FAMILY 4.3 n=1 Tax=Triticum turgidum subsp. durum TaxID=4567 RepID=A0A9R0SGI6_TRITD|nr:unnamed protein product [Triticum turgidum subsp. durum]